ncbi:DUF4251 domain-containing protein [Aequorivita capsosiphonis]|uniref:DUF4251 domain-containing protein n=1 Tax=Aequorivita capsosiphonis TaxID=487317 RepID=UPI00040374C3|nr:DUF4251 domain-containing protein [Aequorivita capsosiphonis]
MKTQKMLIGFLFCFILGSVSAQEKELKADTINGTINNATATIAELLNSKTFEFIANTVFPSGGTPKNLVGSGYFVTFSPEIIISNLPFYGRGYTGMTMGRDKGMRFEGAPKDFNISDGNDYEVKVTVNGESDTYAVSMSVSVSGYATLSISSNDRGPITFQGEVVAVQ